MKNKTRPLSIIETTDPRLLPLIMVAGVEAVIWRRPAVKAVTRSLRDFNEAAFQPTRENVARHAARLEEAHWEGEQLYVSDYTLRQHPDLKPLLQDRALVYRTLKSVFQTDSIYKQNVMIQPSRRTTLDRVFHRDHYMHGENHNFLMFFMTHKGPSTEIIQQNDAGRFTPYTRVSAANYYNPTSLRSKTQPNEHDVVVFKTGRDGTVHRAPYVSTDTRWLTIFTTKKVNTLAKPFKGQLILDL